MKRQGASSRRGTPPGHRVARFPGADEEIERQVVHPPGQQQPAILEQLRDRGAATRIRRSIRARAARTAPGRSRPASAGSRSRRSSSRSRCRGTASSRIQPAIASMLHAENTPSMRHRDTIIGSARGVPSAARPATTTARSRSPRRRDAIGPAARAAAARSACASRIAKSRSRRRQTHGRRRLTVEPSGRSASEAGSSCTAWMPTKCGDAEIAVLAAPAGDRQPGSAVGRADGVRAGDLSAPWSLRAASSCALRRRRHEAAGRLAEHGEQHAEAQRPAERLVREPLAEQRDGQRDGGEPQRPRWRSP